MEVVANITGVNGECAQPVQDASSSKQDGGSNDQSQLETYNGTNIGVGEDNLTNEHVNTEVREGSTGEVRGNLHGAKDLVDNEQLEIERLKDAQTLGDAMRLLYEGSKNTKLGPTMMLVNLVATHPGISDKAADDILATFKCLLPDDNCLPAWMYQANSLTKRLRLDFCNIDGCPKRCVLYDQEKTRNLK
ncbi:hypothetical protein KC19_VG037100 [Ceratodon purpureus]|uniref:Uncharacterized protein n=1 Tax=Ceratodon purpureus TaxID=3225 RepID=A0A8T0HLW5_CERPU|nr:hypothetical protein KC19_VG037100 [Ceratodon purpureus]